MVILCDFSAVSSMVGQDTLTCHQPNEALQEVFVICHGPKGEITSRKHTVDIKHFWGHSAKTSTTKDENDTKEPKDETIGRLIYQNTAYHAGCFNKIIDIYNKLWPELYDCQLENIEMFTDGCKGQYKSRFNCHYLSELCKLFKLKNIVSTWACTTNFKCCVDSGGNDLKRKFHTYARDDRGRCTNAYMLYEMLTQEMPKNLKKSSGYMSFDTREHFYCYDIGQVQKLEAFGFNSNGENMIKIDSTQFYNKYDARAVKRISFQRQARVEVQKINEHVIYTREIHCHCKKCRNYEWNECEFIQKGYEVVKWQKQDISLVGKDKNESNEELKKFYCDWEDKDSVLVLLLLRDIDNSRDHRFATLNSKPYKLEGESLKGQRDKEVKFKSDNTQFKVKLGKDEYRIKVSILIKDGVGNNFVLENNNELELPLSSIYCVDNTYNENCKKDENHFQIKNIRKFQQILDNNNDDFDDV